MLKLGKTKGGSLKKNKLDKKIISLCLPKKMIARFIFSIIVLVYNEEKYLTTLIKKLLDYTKKYTTEFIFIDSESSDNSISIIKKFQKNNPNIRFYQINKKNFHYAKTRNWALKKARGKFIVFISADALPPTRKIFDAIIEDFNLNKRVVAVFFPHKPYQNTPIFSRLEVDCFWERILCFAKNKPVLIQDLKKPFTPLNKKTEFVWYLLSNTFCAYKRSFLLKNPFFSNKEGGEDLFVGKLIIQKNYIKIFDSRFFITHSHNFNLNQYIKREIEFNKIVYFNMKYWKETNIFCKFKRIFTMKIGVITKLHYLFELIFYYFLKIFIFLYLKLSSLLNK